MRRDALRENRLCRMGDPCPSPVCRVDGLTTGALSFCRFVGRLRGGECGSGQVVDTADYAAAALFGTQR
jgi:hypothetical protein